MPYSEAQRAWRLVHREETREKDRVYYQMRKASEEGYKKQKACVRRYQQKLRAKVLAQYDNFCVWCGVCDVRVLQLDHIQGGGHKEWLELGSRGIYKRAVAFPAEYQLLCANCNWIKRAENAALRRASS